MLLPLLAAATILMLLLLVLMLLPASEMGEEGNFDAEYISTAQCVHWKRKLAKTTTGWVWISCLSICHFFFLAWNSQVRVLESGPGYGINK